MHAILSANSLVKHEEIGVKILILQSLPNFKFLNYKME